MITGVVFGKDVLDRCVDFERHSRTQPVVVDAGHERPLVVRLGLALDQRGDGDDLRNVEAERSSLGSRIRRQLAKKLVGEDARDAGGIDADRNQVGARKEKALERPGPRAVDVESRAGRIAVEGGRVDERLRGQARTDLAGGEAFGKRHPDRIGGAGDEAPQYLVGRLVRREEELARSGRPLRRSAAVPGGERRPGWPRRRRAGGRPRRRRTSRRAAR